LHIYSDRHRLLWGEGVQVLIVCKQDPRADPLARELTDRFRRNGVSTTVLIKDVSLYDCSKADVVLVLGGDGTILRTARHFAWLNIPILGINLGKIGFLSSAEADQALATVDKVLRKEYLLDERLMLQVKSVSAMVVTQICPQLAFSRSLVLGANSELGFMLDSDRSTSLYLDGEEPLPLNKGDDIIVQRALDDFSRGYIASRTTETQLL
jgi:NAD kinase